MNCHCVSWNFNDKQLASFVVIIVFISVLFVVEVWTCVVLVVILDLMMRWCVDVNKIRCQK